MSNEIVLKALEDHAKAMEGFRSGIQSDISGIQEQMKNLSHEVDKKLGVRKNLSALDVLGGGRGSMTFENVLTGDITDEAGNLIKRGTMERSTTKGFIGEFSGSEQFKSLANGAPSTGRVQVEGVTLKALTNTGQGVAGTTGFDVQPQRAEGVYNDPRRPLTLLDVIPSLPVDSSSFEYMQLQNYVNTAAFQTEEGQQKAESNFEMTPETANIATVAHWTKASVQVLSDAPALGQKLMSLLEYGVLAKLESEIVAGAGGKGRIKGLVEQGMDFVPSGVADPSTLTPTDRIGAAVVNLQANGWKPGLIIMNPVDWQLISSQKGTDGQYVLGSPRDPSPLTLWNVPVVLTPSLARNISIVMDPAQAAILDREQPSLLASREDGQNFTTNMVTLLGELRAGLAVFAPGAVLIVDVNGDAEPVAP
ncbi:phage major capsid protein, HK97 family [Pseudomonas asplenii]|uniref:Phage major capsid protein, HK97 family n=1 Tax=Pseudomonas asplenii TaxID=53407 RepID=A0A1H6MP06_9PSED|nr:phage major capsid protein [Pseudomonas fuscovaginae]SEI03571.1 phage major capsid protein, HK97 family [Pseudomonas fuscovaginae]